MRFVFSRRFYILLAAGLIPLSLSWRMPWLRSAVLAYDILLVAAALFDYFVSRRLPEGFNIRREFEKRFAIGDPNKISLHVENDTEQTLHLRLKDEYPDEMNLDEPRVAAFTIEPRSTAEFYYHITPPHRGSYSFGKTAVRFRSKLGLIWCQSELAEPQSVKVYPNMRRAREIELRALGSQSFLAVQRRAVRRGEGREFESMRDYVRGDELRHISWTATARRSKLTTRQYQIERDQTVVIAVDAGRLMTGRIEDETKFDTAVHASLALMSACAKAGDN